MRGSKPIKKVNKRHTRFKCCHLSNSGKVLSFLHAGRGQHCKPRLTTSHHVRMISKNRQSMSCYRSGRHMHHKWCQFTCNFIHIWNHQEQPLRRRISRCNGTGLQRPVNGTDGTGFGLHFNNFRYFAPDIFLTGSRPRIGPFPHWRRRRNRVNNGYFVEFMSHSGGRFVPIHHFHLIVRHNSSFRDKKII